jgi:hypothetical protein
LTGGVRRRARAARDGQQVLWLRLAGPGAGAPAIACFKHQLPLCVAGWGEGGSLGWGQQGMARACAARSR